MAKKTIRRPESGTISAKGGKFYFKLEATMTTSAIVVKQSVVVTEPFNEKVKASSTVSGEKVKDGIKAKGTHLIVSEAYPSQESPKIVLKCAGKSVTIKKGEFKFTTTAPPAPTAMRVTKTNDAEFEILASGDEFLTVPVDKIYIERCSTIYDENAFSDIPSSPFNANVHAHHWNNQEFDQSSEITRGERYWYRVCTYNTLADKKSAYIYSGPHYTSSDNTGISGAVTATRISNKEVDVTWSISNVSLVNNDLITGFDVFRSADGGTATKIGHIDADTEHVQYTYKDTNCTADHAYTYMVKSTGKGDATETFTESSDVVYMSPTAPQSVSAAFISGGDVVVSIVNTSNVATQVCIERNIDGTGWSQIAEEEYITGGQSYTDEGPVAVESIVYRVRNKCDQLTGDDQYSGYVSSSTVIEKAPPNPPTLVSPVSGSSVVLDQGTVRLVFRHNPVDGSAQEAAQVRYALNGGAWTTVNLTTQSYYALDISNYSALDVISWQAKTKGAHDDYSEWSSVFTVKILTRPDLAFTAPDNGAVITTLPITLAWNYNDLSGTLLQLTVDIKLNGKKQTTINVPVGNGASGSYSYDLMEFLFQNGTVYSITATALSSSGFSTTADIAITTQYDEISLEGGGGLYPVVTFDEDAIATVVCMRDVTPDEETGDIPEPVTMSQCYLYRAYDGERELIASGLDEGAQVLDKYAPVNLWYSYEMLMLTEDGRVSIVSTDAFQRSTEWFVYWGDNIARARWNPEGQITMKRPEKTQVRYSGRKYPVTYDSSAMEETFGFNFILTDREELNNFRYMMRAGGHGIWKSGDGDVYDADFEFDYSSRYTGPNIYWNCSLSVTRIDGDV